MTSTLVMSNLLPAVTGCSWLVLECAPLEHWGIKHQAAPDLISGTRRDFVLWQRWFCSGFCFHAASVLLVFAEGGCVSGPPQSNLFFFCTSELWPGRPDGVVEGQQHSEMVLLRSAWVKPQHLEFHFIWKAKSRRTNQGWTPSSWNFFFLKKDQSMTQE